MDEAGMSNIPNVQRAWSPLSKPHAADASVSRGRVNVLGALNYGANTLVHTLHQGSVKRDKIVAFIDTLAQQNSASGKPIIVVLDNASIHKNIDKEKIHKWLMDHKLLLWHIPTYSPELNLIEILWKQAKYHWRKFTTWTPFPARGRRIGCTTGRLFPRRYRISPAMKLPAIWIASSLLMPLAPLPIGGRTTNRPLLYVA